MIYGVISMSEILEYLNNIHNIVMKKSDYYLSGKTQLFNDSIFRTKSSKAVDVRNRFSHTQSVVDVAVKIADGVYEGALERGDIIGLTREEFMLLIKIEALVHDWGHTAFGHFGEEQINQFMFQFEATEEYLNRRRENFGYEYEKKQQLNGRKRFYHSEHSAECFIEECKKNNINIKHPLFGEIVTAVLAHSTTLYGGSPKFISGQIIQVADKIAGANGDIEDLIETDVFPKGAFPQNLRGIAEMKEYMRINNAVNEVISEYFSKGIIEGRRGEYKKYKTLLKSLKTELDELEKSKGNNKEKFQEYLDIQIQINLIEDEIKGTYPNLYDIWETRKLVDDICDGPRDILRNENGINGSTINSVLNYRLIHYNVEDYPNFSTYTPEEQVGFSIAMSSNDRFKNEYKAIQENLALKVEKQCKYEFDNEGICESLLDTDNNTLFEAFNDGEFQVILCNRVKSIDDYYDSRDSDLRKSNHIFRVTRETYRSGVTQYIVVVKKIIEQDIRTDGIIPREGVGDFLSSSAFDEAIKRIVILYPEMKNYDIDSEPILHILKDSLVFELQNNEDRAKVSISKCTFVNPKTKKRSGDEYYLLELRPIGVYHDPEFISKCNKLADGIFGNEITQVNETLCEIGLKRIANESIKTVLADDIERE